MANSLKNLRVLYLSNLNEMQGEISSEIKEHKQLSRILLSSASCILVIYEIT